MNSPQYHSMLQLVDMIVEPHRSTCRKITVDYEDLFLIAPGSSGNHQGWEGGYWDHLTEVMNFGLLEYRLHDSTGRIACLESAEQYSLSDVLLMLFLHDLEKPFMYDNPTLRDMTKAERKQFRAGKIAELGIELAPNQLNALEYVEGIPDGQYTPGARLMQPLACVCHKADISSARHDYDFPLSKRDPWKGAKRARPS